MVKTIEDVNINTEKTQYNICIVHILFKCMLNIYQKKIACSKCEQISKDNKSYRVISVYSGTKLHTKIENIMCFKIKQKFLNN